MKFILKYPLALFLIVTFIFFGILQCQTDKKPIVNDLTAVKKEIFKNNVDFLRQTNELMTLVSKDADNKILQEKFQATSHSMLDLRCFVESKKQPY